MVGSRSVVVVGYDGCIVCLRVDDRSYSAFSIQHLRYMIQGNGMVKKRVSQQYKSTATRALTKSTAYISMLRDAFFCRRKSRCNLQCIPSLNAMIPNAMHFKS